MAPKKGAAPNWEALKREWLASDLPIKAFAEKKGVKRPESLCQYAFRHKWREQKEEIEAEIDRRVQAKIVKDGVQEWEDELVLLKGIRAQVSHLIKGHLDKDGNVVAPMPPKLLKELAETVAKSVIAKKHIRGEPVDGEKGKSGPDQHLHLHAHLVRVVNEIEADRDAPTPLIPPPRLGHQRGG